MQEDDPIDRAGGAPDEARGHEPADYCRRLEAYLCRKNDGHLVRIVGPAFEQVCGWAARGVPLAVAERGIDRYFERYYAKGPRRRPIRIEFCEADVLDVFDEWRRAVGVGAPEAAAAGGEAPSRDRTSLPAHLDRVIARLTARRAGSDRRLDAALDVVVGELDAIRSGVKGLRGKARDAVLARLAALDQSLIEAARALLDDQAMDELSVAADAELAPFRDRMLPEAYDRSRRACIERLIRERAGLPEIAFDV